MLAAKKGLPLLCGFAVQSHAWRCGYQIECTILLLKLLCCVSCMMMLCAGWGCGRLDAMEKAWQYDGDATCAADGMCAVSLLPVRLCWLFN